VDGCDGGETAWSLRAKVIDSELDRIYKIIQDSPVNLVRSCNLVNKAVSGRARRGTFQAIVHQSRQMTP
jgi:hypothetical protein